MKVGFDKLVTLFVLSIKSLDLYFATVEPKPGCDNFLIKRRITFGNKNKMTSLLRKQKRMKKFTKKVKELF